MIGVEKQLVLNAANDVTMAVRTAKMAMHWLYTPCTPPVHRKV